MDLMRDPHGRQVAVAQQQRKLDRIPLVSLVSILGVLRNLPTVHHVSQFAVAY
jgi:hypothetical protein